MIPDNSGIQYALKIYIKIYVLIDTLILLRNKFKPNAPKTHRVRFTI